MPFNFNFIPAPPNDDFTNATIIAGSGVSLAGTLRGSSPETNDPPVWPGEINTVWYSWTVRRKWIGDGGCDRGNWVFGSSLHGYNLSGLTVAGERNQHDSVIINAQAGLTYYFAVAEYPPWEPNYTDQGPFQLLLMPGGAPQNDNFANAALLSGTTASIVATNWGATLEPGDPPLVQWDNLKRTLWYEWQAPASGLLQLTDVGSTVPPVVGIYLGTNLDQLSFIGTGEAPVRSNELVHILIDGNYGAGEFWNWV